MIADVQAAIVLQNRFLENSIHDVNWSDANTNIVILKSIIKLLKKSKKTKQWAVAVGKTKQINQTNVKTKTIC